MPRCFTRKRLCEIFSPRACACACACTHHTPAANTFIMIDFNLIIRPCACQYHRTIISNGTNSSSSPSFPTPTRRPPARSRERVRPFEICAGDAAELLGQGLPKIAGPAAAHAVRGLVPSWALRTDTNAATQTTRAAGTCLCSTLSSDAMRARAAQVLGKVSEATHPRVVRRCHVHPRSSATCGCATMPSLPRHTSIIRAIPQKVAGAGFWKSSTACAVFMPPRAHSPTTAHRTSSANASWRWPTCRPIRLTSSLCSSALPCSLPSCVRAHVRANLRLHITPPYTPCAICLFAAKPRLGCPTGCTFPSSLSLRACVGPGKSVSRGGGLSGSRLCSQARV